jgi:hypothetical protein
MLHYTGPPLPDGSTRRLVYVVGYYQAVTNKEFWRPWLFCVKLGDAMQMVSALNGGHPPAMNLPYFNVMLPEFPTEPGTFPAPALHDFVRVNWKPEIPQPIEKPAKPGPDDERRTD